MTVATHLHISFSVSALRFSRRLLWLKVGTSNRKQKFVARYFHDTVVEEGGV